VSGDPLDGVYEYEITLPQHSERGEWRMTWGLLVDQVGNRDDLQAQHLAAAGLPTGFRNG
jgi:hypothetical protein